MPMASTAARHPKNDERPHAVVSDDRPPSSRPDVDSDWLGRLADAALDVLDVPAMSELALTLVDVETITALNAEHMGIDGPTDVLSFPMDGADDAFFPDLDADVVDPEVDLGNARCRLLGDVVICPEIAARNAPDHAGTLEDELALLCVHGILHVLGWDHAEAGEARAMRAEEARVLSVVHRPVGAGTEIPT